MKVVQVYYNSKGVVWIEFENGRFKQILPMLENILNN